MERIAAPDPLAAELRPYRPSPSGTFRGTHGLSRPQTRKGDAVSATVLYMSMSLDGFIAGPNAGPGNGLGDGGHRLHEWFLTGADADHKAIAGRLAGVNGQVVDEFMATGAVVAGRGTFEPAGGWGGDHHDGVPIWVLSRREPGIDVGQWPLVTYVTDIRTAMTRPSGRRGTRTCWCTAPQPRSSRSLPASSTSSRSISSRCSSAKAAVSSTTSVPSTSS
jgi:dihydrofolate reductase